MWSQKLCFGKKWATLKPYPCPWPAPWLSSKRGTNITLQFGPRINISGWDSLASLSPLPWRDSPSPIKLIVFTVLILLMCHTFFSRFFSFLVTIEFSDKMNAFHYLDSSRSKLKRTQWLKITQMSHLNLWILAFSLFLKLTCLVTLFDLKLQVFKNSPKCHFWQF